jgi:hypothetical protein
MFRLFKFLSIIVLCLISITAVLSLLAPEKLVDTYNQARPQLINGGGADCFDELAKNQVKFRRLGNMIENSCLVKDAVRIEAFPNTKLSGPIILNCRAALATQSWFEKIKAKNITHFGTYNCRTMRGSGVASEHSFGTAIDIASINGSSVKRHWQEKSDSGDYIRRAARLACDHFSNSITPDHNALHHDHLHLDMGYGTSCLPPFVQRLEKLTISILGRFL